VLRGAQTAGSGPGPCGEDAIVRSCEADSASSGKGIGAAGGGTAAASAGCASADAVGALLGAARRDDVRVGRFAVVGFAVADLAVTVLGAACFAVGRFAVGFFAVTFLAVTFFAVTFFAVAAFAATVRFLGVVVRFFAAPAAPPPPRAASITRRTSRSRRDTALSTDPSRCASRPSGSALTKPSIASRTLRDASLDVERPRAVREREDAVALLRAAMCGEPHANEAGETTPR